MFEEFQQLMKPSIFDAIAEGISPEESNSNNYSLWTNYNGSYISSNIVHSGMFIHQNTEEDAIELFAELYEDRLVAFYDSQKTVVYGVIDFSANVLLEFTEIDNSNDNEIQFIFLQKQSRFAVMFFESQTEYTDWINILKPKCILANFTQYYSYKKVIGKGTYAKVAMCERIEDKKEFAVKIFDKSTFTKSESLKEIAGLLNEVKIMRQISHPNIIQFHEAYEGVKHFYIVFELLTGGELFDRIQQQKIFHEDEIRALMQNLLQALEYLHAKKIMHRDIKPQNLLIREKNGNLADIVLLDFGLSDSLEKDLIFKRCGTPGFISPEILSNEEYGTKVDVFSAGVLMYILLTGIAPFEGKNCYEVLQKNKVGEIDFDFETMGHYYCFHSLILILAIDLLQKMLKKSPIDRLTIKEALQHQWFKQEEESLITKIHTQIMKELLIQQEQLMQPQNVIENYNPLLLDDCSQNSTAINTPSSFIYSEIQLKISLSNIDDKQK